MPNVYAVMIGHMDGSSQWEEQLAIPDGVDPEMYIQGMLSGFNALEVERYGDKAQLRKFISVDIASAMALPGEKECHPERVCTICNKGFASDENLARHLAGKHPEEF